ncbi:MAG: nitroreductase [Parvularculaceae bacterium]
MGSFKSPALGATLPAAHPSLDTINLLRLRRSTPADFLGEPGPSLEELRAILEIAARVPDHRRVAPFRFILFEGEDRAKFGKVLEAAFRENEPEAEAGRIGYERDRLLRAPAVVAVVSSVNCEHRTPEWEQILTAGAVCQNMLIAASAHGFAAQWITEWYAYDRTVRDALGLGPDERIAGFIYIGTAREDPKERARPDLDVLITRP